MSSSSMVLGLSLGLWDPSTLDIEALRVRVGHTQTFWCRRNTVVP